MSIEKSEIKALVAHDIGARIEDRLEKTQQLEHHYQGGQIALKKAQSNLAVIIQHLEKDFEEGDLADVDVSDPERLKIFVRRWLARVSEMLEQTKEAEYRGQLGAAGMVAGIKKCMEVPLKIFEEERAKLEAVKAALESGAARRDSDGDLEEVEPSRRPGARPAGVRPADPLQARRGPVRRMAEKKTAKKSAKKTPKKPVVRKKTATKKRRCSKCRKTGHTARSCPGE